MFEHSLRQTEKFPMNTEISKYSNFPIFTDKSMQPDFAGCFFSFNLLEGTTCSVLIFNALLE